MPGGSTEASRPGDLHLNASRSGHTLIALWQAGYGERLRGLGGPYEVTIDRAGVSLYAMGAATAPDPAAERRAFIPWSDVERVGLASLSSRVAGGGSEGMTQAMTITAKQVTVPLPVYLPGSEVVDSPFPPRSEMVLAIAQSANALRGKPDAPLNPVDLMRELVVPELDPTLRALAADPDRQSRTADELLGAVVRREPIYGTSSAHIRSVWGRVSSGAGIVLAVGIALTICGLFFDLMALRGAAIVVIVIGGLGVAVALNRVKAAASIAVTELEAGYTLSNAGPTQVDQLDPATSIVIRRAGERALTSVEEKRARAAARLLDAGGPELPPSEWAVLRMRQIVSRGQDPEVAPQVSSEVHGTGAPAAPEWGTASGPRLPARYPLLAGRHSRGIAWYRRSDVQRRRAAEHDAGYTVSRTHRPDLDQVDPVTGYVVRSAGGTRLSRDQERAAVARVRMLGM